MTPVNYLDGLPALSGDDHLNAQRGSWQTLASPHLRAGQDVFIADPYWWDGTYPNSIRLAWGEQSAGALWSVYFWTTSDATDGVFFRVEHRAAGWDFEVDRTLFANLTQTDGRIRFSAGIIADNAESVLVERFFDSRENDALKPPGSGQCMFSVLRRQDGQHIAAIAGPRSHVAYSFPCSQFSEQPRLLTKSWSFLAGGGPTAGNVWPARANVNLGAFTVFPDSGQFSYALADPAGGSSISKPAGPERQLLFATRHIARTEETATPCQRDLLEKISVGSFLETGNKFFPSGISATPSMLEVTLLPTSSLANPEATYVGHVAAVNAMPERTCTLTIDNSLPLGINHKFSTPRQTVEKSFGVASNNLEYSLSTVASAFVDATPLLSVVNVSDASALNADCRTSEFLRMASAPSIQRLVASGKSLSLFHHGWILVKGDSLGERENVELDVVAEYVEHYVESIPLAALRDLHLTGEATFTTSVVVRRMTNPLAPLPGTPGYPPGYSFARVLGTQIADITLKFIS